MGDNCIRCHRSGQDTVHGGIIPEDNIIAEDEDIHSGIADINREAENKGADISGGAAR